MSHFYLAEVLIILAAAAVCVPLFERLRLGPLLGYLVAGIAIGPGALGLVGNVAAIRTLGELGVVFLLFTIGLEFTRERLRLIRPAVYALGISQIGLTAVVIAVVGRLFGYPWEAAAIIGGGLALSSTAIVLPMIAALGRLNTTSGRTIVAVLLLQDLAAGALLVLVQTLAHGGGPLAVQFITAVGKAAVAIGLILIVGRLVLRPLFRLVAGAASSELFVATVLLVSLGTAWATEEAGLSLAFGGFLAGLMLAETEFRHQVAADVEPFRGLLLGLFFITVGMGIDLQLVAAKAGTIVLLSLALMAGKALILAALVRLFGMGWARAVRIGGLLSQGGEFAFISFAAATAAGLIDSSAARLMIAVVALTMMVTPLGVTVFQRLIALLERRNVRFSADLAGEALDVAGHVIIVGAGEIGRIVARMLKAYGVPYVILDLSPERVRLGREAGEPIFFGDATRPEVLKGVRAGEALAVVLTTDAPGVAEGLAAVRRHTFPDLNILIRGGGEEAIVALRKAGLTPVGQEATDTGLKLTGVVLDLWHGRREGGDG